MKQSDYMLHQSVLDSLTPRERHTYFELVRLAAPEDTIHEEFHVPIPKGSCIISYRQLERLLDITRSTIRRALMRLVEKDLIELTNIGQHKGKDGVQFRTLCKIKHYQDQRNNFHEIKREIYRMPTPVEMIQRMEVNHIAFRLTELESLRYQMKGQLSQSDEWMLGQIIQAYKTAKNILTSQETAVSSGKKEDSEVEENRFTDSTQKREVAGTASGS
jgi:hypothetical protein